MKITPSVTERTRTLTEYMKDVSRIPMASPEEEVELAARIQAGDETALLRLVEANLRFVISCAKMHTGRGLELEDLINEGNIGLIKAAEKFDPTRGFRFISYAVFWIRQMMIQAISEQGHMVRLPMNKIWIAGKAYRNRAEFVQKNEREPTDAELAELMDITPEKLAEALNCPASTLSFDTPMGEDGDSTLLDITPDESARKADSELEHESLRDDLTRVMKVLDERERQVVKLSFGLGCCEMSLDEIGLQLEITRERVRQIREKAVRKLSRPAIKARLVQYL